MRDQETAKRRIPRTGRLGSGRLGVRTGRLSRRHRVGDMAGDQLNGFQGARERGAFFGFASGALNRIRHFGSKRKGRPEAATLVDTHIVCQ